MVVVAHPGDEAFGFGGAIASAAASGAYVVVVCATRGWFDARLYQAPPAPGGKNRDVKLGAINWRNVDTVREDELRRSVAVLGVRVVRMLDYAEGDLDQADFDKLVGRIVEPIRMHRPEVILSFGPDGVTGDSDHVVLSRAVRAAFDAAAEPLEYEEIMEEDQVAWRAAKLYDLVVPQAVAAMLGDRLPPDGYGSRRRADAGPRARRPCAAQAGGDQPARVADGVDRAVPRLGSRAPRRVARHRALPPGGLGAPDGARG